MTLFQRLKAPFVENEPEREAPVPVGSHSAGEVLRQQREVVGVGLGDVAAVLKIKPAYLAAIEEGRLDRLPGSTYAVGFVRTYSEYLGLDSGEILRRLKLEAAGLDVKPDLSFPMPLGERGVPGGGMLLVALILAICGYGAWYYLSTAERSRPERVVEVPETLLPAKSEPLKAASSQLTAAVGGSAAGASAAAANAPAADTAADSDPDETEMGAPARAAGPVASTAAAPALPTTGVPAAPAGALTTASPALPRAVPVPVPTTTASPTEASASPSSPQPGTARSYGVVGGSSQVALRATADTWIQIRDTNNHSVLFTGLLKRGDSYQVPDRPGLSMRAGNAGGIEVIVDGKPAPSLGPAGAVRNVALDPQSLMVENAARD